MKKDRSGPLEKFNRWFTSAQGVYQTTFLVLAVVALEFCRPSIDPHGFWMLYALTVYSGITQPMLAYIAAKSSAKTDRILDRMEDMMADEFVMDKKTMGLVEKVLEKLEKK